jgi:hypothetical protein
VQRQLIAIGSPSATVSGERRLDELGRREGKNLIFDFRTAEGSLERLYELAGKFVATSPNVIVTGFGTETAKAAQAAT